MHGLDPYDRASGVILHPTSLPGRFGIGDLGPSARSWIDLLSTSGTSLWQILPLGPTGYADSPYQTFSAFAGNLSMLSPDMLIADGLLTAADAGTAQAPPGPVAYDRVIPIKRRLVDLAHQRFRGHAAAGDIAADFDQFRTVHKAWLDEFSLFMALKEDHGGGPWSDWPREIRLREPDALRLVRRSLSASVEAHTFGQFLFFRQWDAVRAHAAKRGVRIVGDVPIFVAADSADVWANRELFQLDPEGKPSVVAGVPPDTFSETGQRWGNSLYAWERHADTGYAWWIRRLKANFAMADIVRIDHFRAFADYWEIPAESPTAERGAWKDGPGIDFFSTVAGKIPSMPVIAEDLGDLSPAVPLLLESVGFPGMRILQFAFGSDLDDPFLPHNYPPGCVAYTGTHDNETSAAWWRTAPVTERRFAERYLRSTGVDRVGDFLDAIWGSPAMFAIAPLQDLLRLDSDARMNEPGTTEGNWRWRADESDLDDRLTDQLKRLNILYDRASGTQAS